MLRKTLDLSLASLTAGSTLACLLTLSSSALGNTETTSSDCTPPQFTFSWPLSEHCAPSPRGGSSTGADVTIDAAPYPGWQKLQESGLTPFEKDRRAILAMAGPYRVSFDFLEIAGYKSDYQRDKPYQSWGTEYVYVVADEPEFISLQHLMVMYFKDADGKISEPMVMKHWRQDWTYEDKELLVYQGEDRWQHEKVSRKDRKGRWSQAVFQVDDAPRYEAMGRWEHNDSFSSWHSDETSRPLPRRESSVRNDYQILTGYNEHIITRHGWIQEEENLKERLDANGKPLSELPFLAKEIGIARYQPASSVDFAPGDDYMETAGQFWSDVRKAWDEALASADRVHLQSEIDGVPLFATLFDYASKVQEQATYDSAAGYEFAKQTIAKHLTTDN